MDLEQCTIPWQRVVLCWLLRAWVPHLSTSPAPRALSGTVQQAAKQQQCLLIGHSSMVHRESVQRGLAIKFPGNQDSGVNRLVDKRSSRRRRCPVLILSALAKHQATHQWNLPWDGVPRARPRATPSTTRCRRRWVCSPRCPDGTNRTRWEASIVLTERSKGAERV